MWAWLVPKLNLATKNFVLTLPIVSPGILPHNVTGICNDKARLTISDGHMLVPFVGIHIDRYIVETWLLDFHGRVPFLDVFHRLLPLMLRARKPVTRPLLTYRSLWLCVR